MSLISLTMCWRYLEISSNKPKALKVQQYIRKHAFVKCHDKRLVFIDRAAKTDIGERS